MKYTIELTEKQKKQMDFMLDMANKHMEFNRKLEMIETTNVEDTNEYQIGYKVGFEDGKKRAIYENAKDHQGYYNKGLEDGYKGYKYLEQWFNETCFYDDEDNMFPEYKRRQADTCCLEDIITDVGFSEVLNRVKAYEEKKKAEKEIKVGDEVDVNGELAIVTRINPNDYDVFYLDGITGEPFKTSCKKTGRHFDEVSLLLDKLKG